MTLECDEEGCVNRAQHKLIDDDGEVVSYVCETHAEAAVEAGKGELHLRDL